MKRLQKAWSKLLSWIYLLISVSTHRHVGFSVYLLDNHWTTFTSMLLENLGVAHNSVALIFAPKQPCSPTATADWAWKNALSAQLPHSLEKKGTKLLGWPSPSGTHHSRKQQSPLSQDTQTEGEYLDQSHITSAWYSRGIAILYVKF